MSGLLPRKEERGWYRGPRARPFRGTGVLFWRDDLEARTLIAVTALCALFALSCGGGDDGSVSPSASPASATPPAATATAVPEVIAVEDVEATPGLKPSEGDTPAAGICARPTEAVVTIQFLEGIPDPRCTILRPEQRIRFINRLTEPVALTLGRYSATTAPNSSVLFDAPAGSYLAPGVHVVDASVGSARAAIWLQEAP